MGKSKSDISKHFAIKGFWLYELVSNSRIKNKSLFIFLIFIIPPVFIFITPLALRFEMVFQYTIWRIFSLITASTWSFLGPLCIYKYYVRVVSLYQKCISINGISENKTIFVKALKLNRFLIILFTILWIAIVIPVLIFAPNTLYNYSVYGYFDFWYYIFLFYIIFILHLNACGFAGVVTSIMLIYHLSESSLMKIIIRSYPQRLKLLGQFSFHTTIYFFSGIVYIPILIDFINSNTIYPQTGVFLGIFLFCATCLLSFSIPLFFIRKRAAIQKENLIALFVSRYTKSLFNNHLSRCRSRQGLNQLNTYNALQYMLNIQINVIDYSKVLTILTAVILPCLISAWEHMSFWDNLFGVVLKFLFGT